MKNIVTRPSIWILAFILTPLLAQLNLDPPSQGGEAGPVLPSLLAQPSLDPPSQGGGAGPVLPPLYLTCPNEPTLIFDQAVGYCIPLPNGFEHCSSELVYDSRSGQCVVPEQPCPEGYVRQEGECRPCVSCPTPTLETPTQPPTDLPAAEDPCVIDPRAPGCPQLSAEQAPPQPDEENTGQAIEPEFGGGDEATDQTGGGGGEEEDNVDNGGEKEE